jgi:IS605 OrfB family transposase
MGSVEGEIEAVFCLPAKARYLSGKTAFSLDKKRQAPGRWRTFALKAFMKILRAYKTRLSPNKTQVGLFRQYAGTARLIYNWALADRIARYEAGEPTNYFDQKKRFNAIKREQYPWIAEIPYIIQESAFRNLDAAYKNFFRRVKQGEKPGFPKFKSKHKGLGGFTFRAHVTVEKKRIKLPVIGWIKLAEFGYLPTDRAVHSATVSHWGEYWLISVLVEEEKPEPEPAKGEPLGIDVGIKSLAVCSDGTTFDNPKTLYKFEKRLARLQRELSRRKLGGHNREKTRRKIARLYYKISCIRSTTLHTISRYVTAKTKPRVVVMENLNVKGMMQNKHLSKALSDVALGELKLQYKAGWNGIEFIQAGRWFPSSKICSKCGSKKDVLQLSERIYRCAACGAVIDRDYNAAQNLASLAFSSEEGRNTPGLPWGVGVQEGPTVNQEGRKTVADCEVRASLNDG